MLSIRLVPQQLKWAVYMVDPMFILNEYHEWATLERFDLGTWFTTPPCSPQKPRKSHIVLHNYTIRGYGPSAVERLEDFRLFVDAIVAA